MSLRGGYYPLKYDSGTDANVKADDLDDAFQRIRMGRNGGGDRARHTIEKRVGSSRRRCAWTSTCCTSTCRR